MSRYFILVVLGLSGGFLGEELGVQSINLLPKRVLCSDSLFVPILLLMISSIPFFAIASILLLKLQGYASFAKGFLFSLAYYLPFQYRAIWVTLERPTTLPSQTLSGSIAVTLLGTLLLSAIYYSFVTLQKRRKRTGK